MSEEAKEVSPETLALTVSQQIHDILEAKGVGDAEVQYKNLHEYFNANPGILQLMQATMTAMIIDGLKRVLLLPACKHIRDGKFCNRRCGLQTVEGDSLCAPCGVGRNVLLAAILQRPTCSGYESKL